jgi:predicted AlkP superfamily pyrophosphatase or phosphodiesterase
MKHPVLFALAASAVGAACAPDAPGAGPIDVIPAVTVQRVVLISVDGLRADALPSMPNLAALAGIGVWSDSMRTVVPSLTVPGHLAMFTGRDVTQFGVTTNQLDETAGLALGLNGATAVFQWVGDAGGSSVALAGLSLIPTSQLANAQSFFGIDTVIAADREATNIADRAIELATAADRPTLLFVHFPDVDFAGHDYGFIAGAGDETLGTLYAGAAVRVDSAIGRVWSALQSEIAAGTTALVITADHGGGHGAGCTAGVPEVREHCTSHPADVTIPFVLVARDVAPRRLTGVPSIAQVAPTVARLLDVRPPAAAAPAIAY